jgi:hypothetical protein
MINISVLEWYKLIKHKHHSILNVATSVWQGPTGTPRIYSHYQNIDCIPTTSKYERENTQF